MKSSVKNSSPVIPKLMTLLILATLALAASSFYFYQRAENAESTPIAVNAAQLDERNKEDSTRILGDLESILEFEESDPTVARIEDPAVLKEANPEFYAKAQTGDYLVLFPSRAVIYREDSSDDIKKIINIAPIINTNNIDSAATPTPESTATPVDDSSDNN